MVSPQPIGARKGPPPASTTPTPGNMDSAVSGALVSPAGSPAAWPGVGLEIQI